VVDGQRIQRRGQSPAWIDTRVFLRPRRPAAGGQPASGTTSVRQFVAPQRAESARRPSQRLTARAKPAIVAAMSGSHIDRIREQFTRQADAYARMKQTTDERSLEALVGLAGTEATYRVLDVACGPGFLTMAFARAAAAAVGLDATDAFLSLAREEAARRGLTNVEFRAGDAQNLPFDSASFDAVSCRAAFHHFEHPERVLAEMKRVGRPGGRLLVADMLGNEDAAKAMEHDRIERLCDPTHVRALPAAELDELFETAGLQVMLRPTLPMDYDLEEWMEHGGPSAEAAREIVAAMEASLERDRCGLRVRRENGRLRFGHTVAVFVLRLPK
jgi:ubiquinone/menaquinone biosynthesis C-methylase UbiE